ncbi:MAG: arginine--tRNA ligase [Candidatus Paceibacterota bacterium]|jgi:arginyl-tRNA synthetase
MLRKNLEILIERCLKELQKEESFPSFSLDRFSLRSPEGNNHGDYSSNMALVLSKEVGRPPLEIAELLESKLQKEDMLEKVEIAGPGFINLFISKQYLEIEIKNTLKNKENYDVIDIGKGKKVNVEFISANPTGPLTVGNARGGIIGNVLSKILTKAGWKVTKEYYFNDAGGQIDVLGHSVLKDDQSAYKGAYIDELHDKLKEGSAREIGKKAAKILIEEIKKTTKRMGVEFDVWTAEGRDLREKKKVEKIIAWMKEKDLAYELEGALWFKSTQFGDDKDRVLIKSDGEPTYFAVDCAYHKNKLIERKFDRVIDIWGADHHGDIPRVKGFVKALGYEGKLDILIHQFVRIIKDGQEVRMSKRTGNYITIDELLDEVGLDVTVFFFLMKSIDTHLNFDLNLAKEQSDKNPVYYIQYAYARICSIIEKASGIKQEININLLSHPSELDLIKQLLKLPEIIEDTAKDYQIQRLPQYALDLATDFHRFYHNCRVITEDKALSSSRLGLVASSKIALENILKLMGVSAPEKM